ncbi:ABC transporter permease [Thiomicrorhabdus xiamenensis]|uniref:ABC transporter permease n=1 Tax=Thiomicrorhabdus xiamenensis TaxID=2739063 RepID=A0A7D4SHD4_9GAMM|nr:FtsX-like permease family protein [Thiomicrorhabdus xiamenensis]QKI88100.1 ABC transporter permease [Thiomicrorhabdus xiamenensis]
MKQQWPIMIFAWRNLWRYPKRTAILITVTVLGLATTLFFNSLMLSWSNSMLDNTLNNLGAQWQINAPGYQQNRDIEHRFEFSPEQQQALEQSGLYWAQRIHLPGVLKSEYDTTGVDFMAVNLQNEQQLSFIGRFTHSHPELIDKFDKGSQPYQIIVGEALLNRLKTAVGRKLVLMTQGKDGKLAEIGLRITASYRHSDPNIEKSMVFMPLASAQKWLKLPHEISEIAVKSPQTLSLEMVKNANFSSEKLRRITPLFKEQKVLNWRELQPFAFASIEMMYNFNWVWLLMIGIMMLFAMLNTLYMSLYERRNELQRLFILGLKPRDLRRLLLLEHLTVLLISIAISWTLLVALVASLSDGIDLSFLSEGTAWLGISHQLFLGYDYELWLTNTAQLFFGLFLFGMIPIWRATRIPRLKASQHTLDNH